MRRNHRWTRLLAVCLCLAALLAVPASAVDYQEGVDNQTYSGWKTQQFGNNYLTLGISDSRVEYRNDGDRYYDGRTLEVTGVLMVDGLEAVRQAVYVILNVERYQYLIHSWNFGVELRDLFGKPMTWVMPEVKRRIAEALLRDDRVTAVDGFVLTPDRHRLSVSFTVHSVFGNFEGVTEVDV